MLARACLAAVALLSATGPARATPEPRAAVDMSRFVGGWYEILRTPNDHQRNCWAAHQVWSLRRDGQFAIRQGCHKGSRNGPVKAFDSVARALNPPQNTKFESSFFGGLIRQRYWVIDHADDYGWMIATTADGRFPALLARSPSLSATEIERLKARMRQLGLPTSQLTPSEN